MNELEVKNDSGLTLNQLDLIKRTICKGASDDELDMFLNICKKTRLDPFLKQIYAIQLWDGTLRRNVMHPVLGMAGFRVIAERSDKFEGIEGPYWCGQDGAWKDVWLESYPPSASRVFIHKKGFKVPIVGIAHWDECVKKTKDGQVTQMWSKMQALMLAKCAEVNGIRRAFPDDASGLYLQEELQDSSSQDTLINESTQVICKKTVKKGLSGIADLNSTVIKNQSSNHDRFVFLIDAARDRDELRSISVDMKAMEWSKSEKDSLREHVVSKLKDFDKEKEAAILEAEAQDGDENESI